MDEIEKKLGRRFALLLKEAKRHGAADFDKANPLRFKPVGAPYWLEIKPGGVAHRLVIGKQAMHARSITDLEIYMEGLLASKVWNDLVSEWACSLNNQATTLNIE